MSASVFSGPNPSRNVRAPRSASTGASSMTAGRIARPGVCISATSSLQGRCLGLSICRSPPKTSAQTAPFSEKSLAAGQTGVIGVRPNRCHPLAGRSLTRHCGLPWSPRPPPARNGAPEHRRCPPKPSIPQLEGVPVPGAQVTAPRLSSVARGHEHTAQGILRSRRRWHRPTHGSMGRGRLALEL